MNLTKMYTKYSIYYQLYVREPIFDYFLSSANRIYFVANSDGEFTPDDGIREEYERRADEPKAGKSIKIEFKLCHEFCKPVKKLELLFINNIV